LVDLLMDRSNRWKNRKDRRRGRKGDRERIE